jgi:hypothetical protein
MIVRPGPIRVATGGALVDALRQRAHLGDAIGDLLAQEHAAAARLGALADDDLDRVRLAQVVRVHAVARRQHLINEDVGVPALLLRHAAVAGGGRRAGDRGAAAERLFCLRRQRAKRHAGNRDGDFQLDGLLSEAIAQHHVGGALLAIAFQRIARDGGAQKQQIIKVRHLALGARAADVIDAGRGGAADFGQRHVIEGCRFARGGAGDA